MARKSKLTPETHEKIVNLLKRGNYLETAAVCCRVSPQAVRKWLRRGATGEEPYAQFLEDVEQAQAEDEVLTQEQIRVAGKDDVKAAMWRLERKHRDRWGTRITLVTEVREEAVGELLGRLRTRLDPDTYREVLLALRDPEDGREGTGDSVRH